MDRFTVVVLFLLSYAVSNSQALHPFKDARITQLPISNQDSPLVLTPLIEAGKLDEARAAADVDPSLFLGVQSSAGYLTVDDTYNSNLFYWMFPAEQDYDNAPVVLWLQGGPGSTSMFALFEENGPFLFDATGQLILNDYSWHKNTTMVFIDNPAGTGWSYTDENGYAQNQTKVGESLYSALQQFFTLYPELQTKPFFITGESYGGKYVPAISYTIHKRNPTAALKINLQGMAIGNGWTDPRNQVPAYGDYLYQLGLIDSNGLGVFKTSTQEIVDNIDKGDYKAATDAWSYVVGNVFQSLTGFENIYNYLKAFDPVASDQYMSEFLQRPEIRSAIHVGNATFNSGGEVYSNLYADITKSVAPWLAELTCHYRVLIYNGQLDIIVAYPLTVNYLQQWEFCGSDDYAKAERRIWTVDGDVAGYSKVAGNLTEVLVRNAGHMVPGDQPKWALDMLTKFIAQKPIV